MATTARNETIKFNIHPTIFVYDVDGTKIEKDSDKYDIKPAFEYMKKNKKDIVDVLIEDFEYFLKYSNIEIKYFDDIDENHNKTGFIQCILTYDANSLSKNCSSIDDALINSYFTLKHYLEIDSTDKHGGLGPKFGIDNPNNLQYTFHYSISDIYTLDA